MTCFLLLPFLPQTLIAQEKYGGFTEEQLTTDIKTNLLTVVQMKTILNNMDHIADNAFRMDDLASDITDISETIKSGETQFLRCMNAINILVNMKTHLLFYHAQQLKFMIVDDRTKL